MATFEVAANASYIANRSSKRLSQDARGYFGALGVAFWSANPRTDNPNVIDIGFEPPTIDLPNSATQMMCDAFMVQHNNAILTDAEKTNNQAQSAADNLLPHLNALLSLPAADVGYAICGRAMAYKDGAAPAVINAIVDRATATTYLQSKTEWVNLPVASKQWVADHLEMEAFLFQVLVLVLRR